MPLPRFESPESPPPLGPERVRVHGRDYRLVLLHVKTERGGVPDRCRLVLDDDDVGLKDDGVEQFVPCYVPESLVEKGRIE